MKITIFNKNTGQILRCVSCPVGFANMQLLSEEEDFIDGEYSSDMFYIHNFLPVKIEHPPVYGYTFNYATKQWEDHRLPENEWLLIRQKRNELLMQCDWTQLPDVPLTTKEAWASYRGALRDITLQPDPFNITWPQSPGE